MIGSTIKVIIITITLMTFVLNEKLKVVVITLHHKFHLLWEWLLSWKRLSWDTKVEGKGNCPYSMDEWDEWSPEEPLREKRDTTSVNYSSLSWELRTKEWFLKISWPTAKLSRAYKFGTHLEMKKKIYII